MGYYNDLSLGDTDGELWSDEGWHVADRRQPTTTDLPIPPVADILALLAERIAQAELHDDTPAARQLTRAYAALERGVRLAWAYGELLVESASRPSTFHGVTARECDCPNGGRSCWHRAVYDLLIELQETAADTADMDAGVSDYQAMRDFAGSLNMSDIWSDHDA